MSSRNAKAWAENAKDITVNNSGWISIKEESTPNER